MFFDLSIPYDPATDGVRNDRLKLCLAQYATCNITLYTYGMIFELPWDSFVTWTVERDIVVGLNYTAAYEPNEVGDARELEEQGRETGWHK